MSSLDMSVEDHDHYNPDAEGIPETCWCRMQVVREMQKTGTDAGRMAFRCTNKDAVPGAGHLFRWFDTAVYYEFQKLRREIQQLRRLHEVDASETSRVADYEVAVYNPRVALLEAAHDQLKEEFRLFKEDLARERREMGGLLMDLGLSMDHGVAVRERGGDLRVAENGSGAGNQAGRTEE